MNDLILILKKLCVIQQKAPNEKITIEYEETLHNRVHKYCKLNNFVFDDSVKKEFTKIIQFLCSKAVKSESLEFNKRYFFVNTFGKKAYVTQLYSNIESGDLFTYKELCDSILYFSLEGERDAYERTRVESGLNYSNVIVEEVLRVASHISCVEAMYKGKDIDFLFEKFKSFLQPEIESSYEDYQYEFNYINSQLRRANIEIYSGDVLFHNCVDIDLYYLANQKIRSQIQSETGDSGCVPWSHRRIFIDNLKYKTAINNDDKKILDILKEVNYNEDLPENIDLILGKISDYIEKKLKGPKGFIKINDLEQISDLEKIPYIITDDFITSYRKNMHCFRHHSVEANNERTKISKYEKKMLFNIGKCIIYILDNQ